jgi:hypothetical protein
MKIVPIVEGEGELLAVPALLSRLIYELFIFDVFVDSAKFCTKSQMIKREFVGKFVTHTKNINGDAVIFIFDADKLCARNIVPHMLEWAKEFRSDLPCGVVMARREYEVWFMASMESMRGIELGGDKKIPDDFSYAFSVEEISSPKSRFEVFGYKEATHQQALTSKIDFQLAYLRSSSFRKLVREVVRVLTDLGKTPVVPESWIAEESGA